MGILSDLNRKRKKAQKKILKKVAKPFRKVGQKLPKELRWMAPYLSAAVPFMLPGAGLGSGIFSGAGGRAFLSSLANIGGQAIADPEGEDINLLSALMAGGTGYLGSEGVGEGLRRGQLRELPAGMEPGRAMAEFGSELGPISAGGSFWQGAENLGREGLAVAADYLGGAREGLAALGKNPADLYTVKGAKKALTSAAPIVMHGTGDAFKAMADQGYRDWKAADDAEQAQIQATSTHNDAEAARLTMLYNRQAGNSEEVIQETLEANDLGHLYEPPEGAAQGGIIGLRNGGMLNLGGNEMDYRGGGFVPIGQKERADDVPARLSKNEFVMTADAVKAAGGGSVNKGAQRMYNVMNQLEARA